MKPFQSTSYYYHFSLQYDMLSSINKSTQDYKPEDIKPMQSKNRVSDYASHISAVQGGEAYSETVRFNNNDFIVTMEDPKLKVLTDDLLEVLSIHVMRLSEALAFEFTQFTGLSAHSTLLDITALKMNDMDDSFHSYQCASQLAPHNGVVLLSTPSPLRLTMIRKLAGIKAPFFEGTLERKGTIPGFDYPDTPATFLDNAMLTPYYATILQMVSLAFDDILPNTPYPISLLQAKEYLKLQPENHHIKIRFSLMCDEDYRFKDGKEIISHGANIELFIDGSIIQRLMGATQHKEMLETENKGINIHRMLTLYPLTPLQKTVKDTSPYTLLLMLMLFDDETTTRLLSKITFDHVLEYVLKLLSKNNDEHGFVLLDEQSFNRHALEMLRGAMARYGLDPKHLETIPYDQSVRVANIALHINRKKS